MMKKIITLGVLSLTSVGAAANGWDVEVGYENHSFGGNVTFGAVAVTGGYRLDMADDLAGTFEVGLARGLDDDNFQSITVDMGTTFSAAYRLTKPLHGDFSLYARAAYSLAGGSSPDDLGGVDVGTDEGRFGLGAGMVYRGFVLGFTLYQGDAANYRVIHAGYRWQL